MAKVVSRYLVVQGNSESIHYAVHRDGYYLSGHDWHDTPIWSTNLREAAIYCQESAEQLANQYDCEYDQLHVDLDLTA